MPSLRLFSFLILSLMGHAAVLVPLSQQLPSLFDANEVESDTVIVSIRNVGSVTVEESSDPVESPPPSSEYTQMNTTQLRKTQQRGDHVAKSKRVARQVDSPQPRLADAEPIPAEQPANEAMDARPRLSNHQVDPVYRANNRSEQSDEFEARRHRQRRAEERYLAELLNAVAKYRFYPKIARKKGYQGSVEIELIILSNGEFESVTIGKPSNYHSLNTATTRAFNRLKRFKPFPSDIHRDSWHLSIPFRYVLNTAGNNRS